MKKIYGALVTMVFIIGMVTFFDTSAFPERRDRQKNQNEACERVCLGNHETCHAAANTLHDMKKKMIAIALCNNEKEKCFQTCASAKPAEHRGESRCGKSCNDEERNCFRKSEGIRDGHRKNRAMDQCRESNKRCQSDCGHR